MKPPLRSVAAGLLLLMSAVLRGAEAPELHGMIVTSSSQKFLVTPKPGEKGQWVSVGDTVGDWTVQEFRTKDQTLVLKGADGAEQDLAMSGAGTKQGDAPATLADAQRLFQKMHFSEMFQKIMEQQKEMMARQLGQNLSRGFAGRATPEQMAQFQKQLLDKMWSGIDSQQIGDAMTKIYSETFTSDQLNSLADFYDSPTGQALIEKTPAIQGKIGQLVQAQVQQQIPAIIQMQKDFAAAHPVAAATPAAPAPAAAAHP